MTSDPAERDQLLDIYATTRTIAVVGASANVEKDAHEIPRYLKSQGYGIVPVNPRGGEILGEKVHASLRDIDVLRPPEEAEAVAQDAIAIGAKVLWFQGGTHTDEAVRLATEAGLTVISGRCLGSTHGELGLGPGPWNSDG